MKRIKPAVGMGTLLILLGSSCTFGQNAPAVYLGTDRFLSSRNYPGLSGYTVESQGISFGTILPVYTGSVRADYIIRAMIHSSGHHLEPELKKRSYFGGSNVLMIGYEFLPGAGFHVIPQAGIGFHAESFYENWESGTVYGFFLTDLSVRCMREGSRFDYGIMLNFESGLYPQYETYHRHCLLMISGLIALKQMNPPDIFTWIKSH